MQWDHSATSFGKFKKWHKYFCNAFLLFVFINNWLDFSVGIKQLMIQFNVKWVTIHFKHLFTKTTISYNFFFFFDYSEYFYFAVTSIVLFNFFNVPNNSKYFTTVQLSSSYLFLLVLCCIVKTNGLLTIKYFIIIFKDMTIWHPNGISNILGKVILW